MEAATGVIVILVLIALASGSASILVDRTSRFASDTLAGLAICALGLCCLLTLLLALSSAPVPLNHAPQAQEPVSADG